MLDVFSLLCSSVFYPLLSLHLIHTRGSPCEQLHSPILLHPTPLPMRIMLCCFVDDERTLLLVSSILQRGVALAYHALGTDW